LKAITASEAKSGFDDFIEAVQSEPVLVTQENRPIGVMLSMRDVETLFGGDADAIVATLKEKRLDIQLAQSRQQAARREVERADDAFFEVRRENIRKKFGAG